MPLLVSGHRAGSCTVCKRARAVAVDRAGARCERCAAALWNAWASAHHRRPRGMGGRRGHDTAADLLVLCGSGTTGCHGWVEANRAEAREDGLLVPPWGDTTLVPVRLHVGLVLLAPDGGYQAAA